MFVWDNKAVSKGMISHGTIMNCLLIEHIVAYLCNSFRNYDIEKNGVPDTHGVYRAPTEWTLQTIESFYDCILLGYTMKHLIDMTHEQFHHEAILTYWIIIDCLLMFFIAPYVYASRYSRIPTEITKNIYSLNFV